MWNQCLNPNRIHGLKGGSLVPPLNELREALLIKYLSLGGEVHGKSRRRARDVRDRQIFVIDANPV